jgi:hypothetical protein
MLSVCESTTLLTFECRNQPLWNLVCISWHLSPSQRLLHKSVTSVCVSLCVSLSSLQGKGSVKCMPPFVAKQRLCEYVLTATNTPNNRRVVGRVCLCNPIPFLSNNLVETIPLQRTIVEGVVFNAIHLVSNKSRGLVFPRTSRFFFFFVCSHFVIGFRALKFTCK